MSRLIVLRDLIFLADNHIIKADFENCLVVIASGKCHEVSQKKFRDFSIDNSKYRE